MKLKPRRGQRSIGSFYFFFVSAIVLLVVLLWMQVAFNLMVDYRLQQLESQNSAFSTQIEPYSEENANEEQMFAEAGKTPHYAISDSEREIIERVVMAEAMGEPYEGQLGVALTILDRSVLWGKTPVEVVSQDSQYADMYQGEISESVHQAVSDVFDHGLRVFDEPVTHFYSGAEPYWADSKESRGSISGHTFMY